MRHLEKVHVDLSGTIRTKGLKNEMYYALFWDDFSSSCHIYFMQSKSKEEVFKVFTSYLSLAERQTCLKLKQFTLGRGGEFLNDLLGAELRKRGIVLHLTAAHSPEENGVSERGNRTISTKARSMMLEASMPLRFWVQACKTAVFLTNRTITTSLSDNRSPFEAWHFRKPLVDHLKVFGCLSYALIRKELRGSKFNPVSSPGVLMGFDEDNFKFHIYDLASEKVIITHHATFNENVFPFSKSDVSSSGPQPNSLPPGSSVNVQFFDDDSDDEHVEELGGEGDSPRLRSDTMTDSPHQPGPSTGPSSTLPVVSAGQEPVPPRRSGRTDGTIRYTTSAVCDNMDLSCFHTRWEESQQLKCEIPECDMVTGSSDAPRSYSKAVNSVEGDQWKKACQKEIGAMRDKGVWKLVDRPKNVNMIRGLWLFRKKPTIDPKNPIKFKARYVAMGNTQIEGLDYVETFAPTGKPTSFQLFIAIAAINGWEVHLMDAVTAFLNRNLDETIYVEQPEGFIKPGEENKVCLLIKSLYGLKQAQK